VKAILLVLDSVGVGALPDAHLYGDEGSHTLGHIAEAVKGLRLPNLRRLGLGRITPVWGLDAARPAAGAYGKMGELSAGKDTTTGHWEIAGLVMETPLPTFPQGFPAELIETFEKAAGTKVLGNKVASGTQIIEELWSEHQKTGYPIVYTSADSVFQIAAHEEIIPLEELYELCRIARRILSGKWAVGRVIARPFIGTPGNFIRTANRHDFSLEPPGPTILDVLQANGQEVVGIGKIADIFAGRGITRSIPTKNNWDGIRKTMNAWRELQSGLIFTNLVDFDSLYGHRNNPQGYAQALEEADQGIGQLLELFDREQKQELKQEKEQDQKMLIITADHGNDPTTVSTDHSREYVPLLVYGKNIKADYNLGVRKTFADIAATLSEFFKVAYCCPGESFLDLIRRA
jgi:phosphopentomutase